MSTAVTSWANNRRKINETKRSNLKNSHPWRKSFRCGLPAVSSLGVFRERHPWNTVFGFTPLGRHMVRCLFCMSSLDLFFLENGALNVKDCLQFLFSPTQCLMLKENTKKLGTCGSVFPAVVTQHLQDRCVVPLWV